MRKEKLWIFGVLGLASSVLSGCYSDVSPVVISLIPSNPYYFDTLSVQIDVPATGPDGEALEDSNYSYTWYRGDERMTSYKGSTVDAPDQELIKPTLADYEGRTGYFEAGYKWTINDGEEWKVEVQPGDGPVSTAVVTVNSLPTASPDWVQGDSALDWGNSTLDLMVSTNEKVDDGLEDTLVDPDEVSGRLTDEPEAKLLIEWEYQEQGDAEDAWLPHTPVEKDTVADDPGDIIQKNHNWRVMVTPYVDLPGSASESTAYGEPTVLVLAMEDQPPTIVGVPVVRTDDVGDGDQDPATVSASDELYCSGFSVEDDDTEGEFIGYEIDWVNDSNSIVLGQEETLSGGFAFKDHVRCDVTPYDSELEVYGSVAPGVATEVGNAVPVVVSVQVFAATDVDGDGDAETIIYDDVLSCTTVIEDVDEHLTDPVVAYTWEVNGTLVSGAIDTLDHDFSIDDEVVCSATPTDEEGGVGDQVWSGLVVIADYPNARPSITDVEITPDPASVGDTLSCNYTGYYDAEGDPDQSMIVWSVNGTELDGLPWVHHSLNTHTGCAVDELGRVNCWGNDQYNLPEKTPTESDLVKVSVGEDHACAITREGEVACWGTDDLGTSDYGQVTDAPTGGGYAAVGCSSRLSCALGTSGEVECWGQNWGGLISDVPSGSFEALAVGYDHVCVADSGGAISCWGNEGTKLTNQAPNVSEVTAFAAATGDTCLLDGQGEIHCWSSYSGSAIDTNSIPSGIGFTDIAVATYHACVINDLSEVECWGWDSEGTVNDTPLDSGYIQVQVDAYASCAIRTTGELVCWGPDAGSFYDWGQVSEAPLGMAPYGDTLTYPLALGDTVSCEVIPYDGNGFGSSVLSQTVDVDNQKPTVEDVGILPDPADATDELTCDYTFDDPDGNKDTSRIEWSINGSSVDGLSWTGLSADNEHACAIDLSGQVRCWGRDHVAQVSSVPTGTGFAAVELGLSVTCVLSRQGQIYCGGGQPKVNNKTPAGSGYVKISVGQTAACALDGSGSIDCWGNDLYNQVSEAPSGDGYLDVGVGDFLACALDASGAIGCWGDKNAYFGSMVQAPTETGFVSLSVSYNHACALDGSGVPSCWGEDGDQQVSGAPTDAGYRNIAVMMNRSCALDLNGGVVCWGRDAYSIVSGVPTDSGYVGVAGGAYFVCAVDGTGLVECWGINDSTDSEDHGQVSAAPDALSPTGDVLPSDFTAAGDEITCTVTPYDGIAEGSSLSSDPLTITNNAPSVSDVTITPSIPGTTETLTCDYDFYDADGDSDASSITWTDGSGTELGTGATLDYGFAGGETVTCTVTPDDGSDQGSPVSATVTVNQPPVVSGVSITPDPAAVGDTLTCNYTFSDGDGDGDVGSLIEWTNGSGTELGTDATLAPANFTGGDMVDCVVTPFDGIEYGTPESANIVVMSGCSDDADCDGVLTTFDCDDDDALNVLADDCDQDTVLRADDCDDDDDSLGDIALDGDCDGVLATVDCDDSSAANTRADDCDQDTVLRADDCDDDDDSVGDIADDADCDGVLYLVDCDDGDPFNLLADDCDEDGANRATDCDDDDASLGDISLDGDCDGVLATVDCDDSDALNLLTDDCDEDGANRATDCDDDDPSLGDVSLDGDCDGVLATVDCDDTSAAITLDDDCDGDGVATNADCDDNDTSLGNINNDADCDGVTTAVDCDDNDSFLGDSSLDLDCDGAVPPMDCDNNDELSTWQIDDADCDLVHSSVDCDDNDPGITWGPSDDNDIDGVECSADCDDTDDTLGDIANDADCDGVLEGDDCDDDDPTLGDTSLDPDCDGIICFLDDCDMSVDIGNGIRADFNLISNGDGTDLADPIGQYTLTNDFYMMTTEVTQGMFLEMLDYDSHDDQSTLNGVSTDHPAYYLNWHMSAAFANAVTAQHNSVNGTSLSECYSCSGTGTSVTCSEAITPYQCDGYRLPTDGEWEVAARSGTTSEFWTGDGTSLGGTWSSDDCLSVTIQDGIGNPPLSDYAWFCENSSSLTQPVGQKLPNGFGLFDMHGNLFEWTADWHGCSFPAPSVDPVCSTPNPDRIMRGGYWGSVPSYLRSTNRLHFPPELRDNAFGTRLARTYSQDLDADGVSSLSDCDDSDPLLGDSSLDEDCDGSTTGDDCDDYDPSLGAIADDGDCDGVLTSDDCDDTDPSLGPIADDADCDGVPTAYDCDDEDETIGVCGAYVKVSAGVIHTCGLTADGMVVCWGIDNGITDDGDFGQVTDTPETGGFIDVSVGMYHSCAVTSAGAIECWGVDTADPFHPDYGQVTDAPTSGTYDSLDAGDMHTCALNTAGEAVCWGDNGDAQCDATTGPFYGLSAGAKHTCARLNNVLTCWGTEWYGEASPPGGSFIEVSAGQDHSCGVKNDNTLACWGDDTDGRSTPPAGSYIDVSAGAAHACAVDSDGDLACWGLATSGQSTPPTGDDYTNVSAGAWYTCAVTSQGHVDCWGDDSGYGEATSHCAWDFDCDGTVAIDDCDDRNASSSIVATDGDCDGVLTAPDCDDSDPLLGDSALDGDCDGVLTDDDCDDSDSFLGDSAYDADCDGVVTSDDCDDTDDTNTWTLSTDADCDGILNVSYTAQGIELLHIPVGGFDMGCTAGQSSCDSDEGTQLPITLTNDLWMSGTEVTQGQWEALMSNNPSLLNNGSCATCPVESVTWWDALAFANEMSVVEGLDECVTLNGCTGTPGVDLLCSSYTITSGSIYECEGYRLPTEAEWEYASRAGLDTLYAGSDTLSDVGWYSLNSSGTTHAVNGYIPNPWGLYDMSGNVWEWTWDTYSSDYYPDRAAAYKDDGALYQAMKDADDQWQVDTANYAKAMDAATNALGEMNGAYYDAALVLCGGNYSANSTCWDAEFVSAKDSLSTTYGVTFSDDGAYEDFFNPMEIDDFDLPPAPGSRPTVPPDPDESDYYYDPVWESGTTAVLRGGSWEDGSTEARVANRFEFDLDTPADSLGFRLARTVLSDADLDGVPTDDDCDDSDPDNTQTLPGCGFSDIRLKENISALGSSRFSHLGLGEYRWTWAPVAAELYGLHGSSRGVLAQEVALVVPEAIGFDELGYLRVNYKLLLRSEPIIMNSVNAHLECDVAGWAELPDSR